MRTSSNTGVYKPIYGICETLADGSFVLAAESAVLLFAKERPVLDDVIFL